ncbi:MAG: glycosyltransferase family 9 protein [Isosphaeraceae bacterium]|nr:glycosyltransferase family 9 protein [Isosphaeraceae bacterium]
MQKLLCKQRWEAPPPRRVAVLRALQLGDMLCAVPALRALRAALPGAEIVLIGLPWARAFAERFGGYLDGFREFPGYPGLPERPAQIGRLPSFLAEMQAERFDLAIQMHGSGRISNPLTVLLGARRCAGFYRSGEFCPDPQRFLPWPEHGSEIRRLLELMRHLGAPAQGEHLEFPLRLEDRRALWTIEEARALRPGTYACVHPGASVPGRRWPVDRFAAVADVLAARGLQVVLTGTTAEAGLTRAVARAMRSSCLDLAGRTDLGALGALLSGARLLVCNDTGLSHLAAALRVPSVVISIESDPERWAPLDRARHRVLDGDSGVTPRDVIAEAEDLLRHGPDHLEIGREVFASA